MLLLNHERDQQSALVVLILFVLTLASSTLTLSYLSQRASVDFLSSSHDNYISTFSMFILFAKFGESAALKVNEVKKCLKWLILLI